MPVPTSGDFNMFGTANTTIQGAIVEGGASGASSATDFNTMKALASVNKFDPAFAPEVVDIRQVESSQQFRGYPKTSTALSIGTNLGSGFSSSTVACTSTASPATVYVSDGGYQSFYNIYIDGKRLWANSTLTTPYNGNNLWFKTTTSAYNGDSFQVGTDGFIQAWNFSCADPVNPGTPCSSEVNAGKGYSWPQENVVNLGSSTGTVTLDFDTISFPDRCIVEWNSSIVIDTGFRGDTLYSFNSSAPYLRNIFTGSIAGELDPLLLVTYPNFTEFPTDGYPAVLSNDTQSFTFNKSSASPTTATMKIYGPKSGTVWTASLSCPV